MFLAVKTSAYPIASNPVVSEQVVRYQDSTNTESEYSLDLTAEEVLNIAKYDMYIN